MSDLIREVSDLVVLLELDPKYAGCATLVSVKFALAAAQQAEQASEPVARMWVQVCTQEERSWPEDVGQENGAYFNTCTRCDRQFIGHKRRRICRVCDQHPPRPAVRLTEEELREAFADRVAVEAERERIVADGWRQCAQGQRTTQFCGQLQKAVEAEREAISKFCADVYEKSASRDDGLDPFENGIKWTTEQISSWIEKRGAA